MTSTRALLLAVLAVTAPATLPAQEVPPMSMAPDAPGWDSARAQELIERARARRLLPQQDTALRNYSARAEGFVYFYLDRRDTDERTLVKVDQVALDVFWAPPSRTKQRIVGLRDVSRLPNRMHYHLDHLTVVQDGFGDVIRMGDGDEVGDVPHPAAQGSDSIYEFRLADSLTIRLPGATEPIRVYELQVRPRRLDRSALVGSVFVDRARGDIVRMTFTFTPASYVDRRLDYISVSLDNGLWDGRYWLPHEQTLQIRRQVPELDFAAGAVIHGRMRISDYVFNDTLPETTFYGHRVSAAPPNERQAFEFERGIYDDVNEAGLAPPADLGRIRQQAAALLGTARLSGLPRWRLNIASASSAFRYNRAEGVAIGGGVAYVPGPTWRADATLGYAFGPERPWGTAALRRGLLARGDIVLQLGLRVPRDLGVAPSVPPAINTLGALFLGEDRLDPYYVSSAGLTVRRGAGSRLVGILGLGLEQHRSAGLTQGAPPFRDSTRFRAVHAIDDGEFAVATIGLSRTTPDPRAAAWGGGVQLEAGSGTDAEWLRPTAGLWWRVATRDHARSLRLSATAGGVTAGAPSQRLFLLGGQGTLPGYDYRSFVGSRYGLLQAEATARVAGPWLGVRLVGAAGAAGGAQPPDESLVPASAACTARCAWTTWRGEPSRGVRFSAGAGVSLFWDLLRVDAVRGLNGGSWQLLFSFHPEFWDLS